ncbi:MAG: DUF4340 domain-containing protein, partial [Mizugakiibacter sp.]|uniref:DUF4340 domain-containing protein n=1 Tax=Mizugakiibacter sp. TaxID=1972610 RepID=UPI00320CD763
MVRARTLLLLAVLAALAVAAAIALNWRRAPAVDLGGNAAPLLPELAANVNAVDRVDLVGAGGDVRVTLRRGASGWTVGQRHGYPADVVALRGLLLQLAQARLAEPKTADPARYAVLGVEDVAQPRAGGVQVALHGLARPLALIVGRYDPRAGGTFARRPGEARSWLAMGDLRVDADPAHWLEREIADIPAARVREVTLAPTGGPAFTVYKTHRDDSHYSAREIVRRRELATPYAAEDIAAALAGLELDDVYVASVRTPPAGAAPAHARFRTWDGLTVDADAWRQGGQNFVRLRATAEPAAAAASPAGTRAAADEAARLNARWQGWTYCLPAYRYAAFDRRFDSLLRPAREAGAPATAAS